VKLRNKDNQYLVAASQNRGPLKVFALRNKVNCIPVLQDDAYAMINYVDGAVRKEELYYGQSFLSQSARFVSISDKIKSVTITDNKGKTRTIKR